MSGISNDNGHTKKSGQDDQNLKAPGEPSRCYSVNHGANNSISVTRINSGINVEGPSSSALFNNHMARQLTRSTMPNSVPSESGDGGEDSDNGTDTEEDVCFPMDAEHNRPDGIDFEELQQFIDNQREENRGLVKGSAKYADDSPGYDHYDYSDGSNVAFKTKNHKLKFISNGNRKLSKAAMKYIPKWLQHSEAAKSTISLHDFGAEQGNENARNNESISDASSAEHKEIPPTIDVVSQEARIEDENEISKKSENNANDNIQVPDRFSLFTSASESTIHAPDLPSLVKPGQSIKDLFSTEDQNFVWWLNCCCATDDEIKILSKAFGIHPLTTEDIRMCEKREKVEFFKDYYFITFHSFDSDAESEEFLEPINFYMVVFKFGILTFQFAPVVHCINVRRRIRQLKGYIPLSPDWICYALIDNITDTFSPVINAIDYETDAIEATVFVIRDANFSTMLHRICHSRRKVMTLIRLLGGKADVLKMLFKRCHDYKSITDPLNENNGENINNGVTIAENRAQLNLLSFNNAILAANSGAEMNNGNGSESLGNKRITPSNSAPLIAGLGDTIQPRAEIALFLCDIQDHIITMNMTLTSYEKILSRSHANYLTQLQVESFNSNHTITEMLSKVTVIGTILVPLNVITGLFGMNVIVPGQEASGLGWWFGILGVIIFAIFMGLCVAKLWLTRVRHTIEEMNRNGDDSRSFVSRFIHRGRDVPRNNADNNSRSIISIPNL